MSAATFWDGVYFISQILRAHARPHPRRRSPRAGTERTANRLWRRSHRKVGPPKRAHDFAQAAHVRREEARSACLVSVSQTMITPSALVRYGQSRLLRPALSTECYSS